MKTIYKYKIDLTDEPNVSMPYNHNILSVGMQNGEMFIWAEVDSDETHVIDIPFRIYGTGHELDKHHNDYKFIQTVFDPRGYVWHVYKK